MPLFQAAHDLEQRMPSPPLVAQTNHWWARALLARDAAGDRVDAETRLRHSISEADRMGMAHLARRGREIAGAHDFAP